MVLVRKLKQMEALEVQQFTRSFDYSESTSPALPIPELNVGANDSARIRKRRTPSPPRRPVTRSQTYGHPPPIRRRGDHFEDKRSVAKMDVPLPQDVPSSASSLEPELVPRKEDSTGSTKVSSPQYTFLGASPPTVERRGPRSRAALPVPVPNLTKKSRGRRVPTKPSNDRDGAQKSTRIYVCKVEDCGKCFNRGEHLKRHIRSIHTHEKPFECPYPACEKFFNRHDNLLQHLKVHKNFVVTQNGPDPQRAPSPVATERPLPPKAVTDIPSYVPYDQTPSYTTNMAVSSLRTELPRESSLHRDITGQLHYHYDGDPISSRNTPYHIQQYSRVHPNQQTWLR